MRIQPFSVKPSYNYQFICESLPLLFKPSTAYYFFKIYVRERNISVRENILTDCLTYAPQPRTEPAIWACVLTRNLTDDLSMRAWADAQPTEPHWPAWFMYFLMIIKFYFHIASKSQSFPDFVEKDSILSSRTTTVISPLPKVSTINYVS